MAKKNTFGRKILSVLLAVMMVVGMVGTAFAQGTAADPYDIGDIAYSDSRYNRPTGVIPENTEWEYQYSTETVYGCGKEEHEHSRRCGWGRNCGLEEHEHSRNRCGISEDSKAVWKLVEKRQQDGWGGGYVLDERYYDGSRKFGWDTYTQYATMMDANGNDVYNQITVSVGGVTLSKGSVSNTVTNDDVVANGVTIENIPAGFYISAYKIVCEKYACLTDQAGNATDETVSLDAGKGSYSVGVSKADMGHANNGATKYWILIEISAYEEEQETIVTYPYSVLYNYGELAEELADAAATVDSNTYAMNATATILSPAALEAAAALGYTFLGWEVESVRGSFAVTNGVVGMLVDPADSLTITGETTLKALWEKVETPTYDIGYVVQGAAPETHSAMPAAEHDVEVGAAKTVAAGLTTTETTKNGVVGTWTFNGWTTDDASVSEGAFAMPANDVEFVGTWSFKAAPTCSVTYNVEGDAPASYSAVPAAETGILEGTAKTVAAGLTTTETTRNGVVGTWTFNGWTTDDASVSNGAFAMPANNVEFVGTWTFEAAPTYSITYVVEGDAPASYSAVPTAETGILEGTAKTVKAGLTTTETTREGVVGTWTFNGWTTDDASVSNGAFAMPGSNVEFVGTWTFEAAPTYSITYVVEGDAPASYSVLPAAETGILEGTAKTVAAGLTTTETTREGVVGTWTFNGWTTDDASVANGAFAMPGNNVQFVGTWSFEAAPTYGYTVVAAYYTNNEPDASKTLATVEGVLALPAVSAVEASYSAANTVNNGLTYGYTSISFADGVYTLRYDRTVYQISYRVEGDAPASSSEIPAVESGIEAGAAKTVKAGLTTTETTREGVVGTWTFNGWTTDDASVSNGAFAMPAANVEFVGTWSFEAAPTYTITYTVVGDAPATFSEFSPLESGVLEGTEKLVADGLTTEETVHNGRTGTWTFNGWTTEDADVVNGVFLMPGQNVVFVGTWSFRIKVIPVDPQPEPIPDPVSGDEELEDLPDEDVPLADVPQTGGLMGLFIAMTAVSGAGLLALNWKKKEEEE